MSIVIIRSMFVKEGRNKLYIHASLRKKGFIVSLILALRKAYARSNKSRSSRIKVIAENVVYKVFEPLKVFGKYVQYQAGHKNSTFFPHFIFMCSV